MLGCPEVLAPNGSYVSNGTLTSRTFLCKSGSVFPDSRERKRTLECRNGKWNETATKLPNCVGKNLPIQFTTLPPFCSINISPSHFVYFIYRLYFIYIYRSFSRASAMFFYHICLYCLNCRTTYIHYAQ